ncbi:MAG: hypothetical protein EAS51_05245 [Microbacteriaceae bacterium]|nr:MAG: hypothetical protein EAS51_05245 [Microbacteriaceae bacterium]
MAVYKDAAELVKVAALEDIYCNEERGRRIQWSEADLDGRTLPDIDSSMGIVREGDAVHFRFRTIYSDVSAEYVADWTAHFTMPANAEFADEVLQEFAEKVAFFSVYPYTRASIYGSASRLNQPVPVLGIVRQGEFQRGEKLSEEAVRALFMDNRSERVASESD